MRGESTYGVTAARNPRNKPKGLRLETLEQRLVLTADLVISEILASNDTGLEDEDGRRSDWIEIFNAGTSAANLDGWHLTDDAQEMTKWRFPAITLDAGDYLLVFASGANRIDPASELHTNFSLNASGEYLALVEPDGATVAFDFAPAFPEQRTDVSHGLQQAVDETLLIESGAAATVLVPPDDSLGTDWTQVGFDDSHWIAGTTGVGYERTSGYEALINTDVEGEMFGVSESIYVRIPFTVDDPEAAFSMTLRMKYDDGFAAYINGQFVDSRNAPDVDMLNADSRATSSNSDSNAVNFEDLDISRFANLLQPGENVLAIHGLNASASNSDMLILPELKSGTKGEIDVSQRLFFAEPSPGLPNGAGFLGLVDDTSFDVDRGFYDEPFDVTITTDTPGAMILYTTDGSEPTGRGGIEYTGPIHIDGTTTLRAQAFLDGFAPSNVDTQSYLFLEDVLSQNGSGLPTQWGFFDDLGPSPPARVTADYSIDPDVVNDGRYRDTLLDDLRSIPSLSLVLDPNDLWSRTQGIYANPMESGSDWERSGSIELLNTDGETEFQTDAGVRIHGGWGRRPSQTNKHSFRLLFKREHGPTKLRYPWFGEDATDEFDTIVLRAGFNDSWAPGGNTQTTYANDQWVAQTQREMGGLSPHSTYVHMYVNGLYWGVYSPTERPNASFAASYSGGNKAEYDAYVTGKLIDGDSTAWNRMFTLLRQGNIDYDAVQQILDVPSFIDYLIVNQFGGNWDWPHNNWYASRHRTPEGKWRFHSWDAEGIFRNVNENRVNSFGSNGPGEVYQRLRSVEEFRVAFGDAVQKHFFNNGLLTEDKNIARLDAIVSQIDRAIVGESARWGDGRTNGVSPSRTRDSHWIPRINSIQRSYFPARNDIVLNQYRSANLFPTVPAPEFNQHGGTIPPGFQLVIDSDNEVYYTRDGTDPRLPGGAIHPDAILYESGDPVSLLASAANATALIPTDDSLGTNWQDVRFDDAGWIEGVTGLGFERGSGYEALIGLDVEDAMWNQNATAYLRVPFTVDDAAALDKLVLKMKYDDGFVAYLNGVMVAQDNAPDLVDLTWRSNATLSHSDALAVEFQDFDISQFLHLLRDGENMLAIHGLNVGAASADFLILPELHAAVSGAGLRLDESTVVKARTLDARRGWSPLLQATFIVDTPPSLRITEIMYNPADPGPGSPYTDRDFEFIELQNIGESTLDLSGIQFTDGIAYSFAEMDLEPGDHVVLVSNQPAFESRYGVVDNVVGEFTGNLNNGGERIQLTTPFGVSIHDFSYDDDWYPETDGDGHSLVIVDAAADPDSWGTAESWRASTRIGGSPGSLEQTQPGDTNGDGVVDIVDLNNVRNNFGGAGLGDTNGDGVVDIVDLNEVRNHFGESAAARIFVSAAPVANVAPAIRSRTRLLDAERLRRRDDAVDQIHADLRMRRLELAESAAFRAARGHRPATTVHGDWDAALDSLIHEQPEHIRIDGRS